MAGCGGDGCYRDSSEGKTWTRPATRLTCFSGSFCDARRLFEEVGHGGLTDLQVIGPVGLWRHEQ